MSERIDVEEFRRNGFLIVGGLSAGTVDEGCRSLEDAVRNLGEPASYFDQPLVMQLSPKKGFDSASFAGTEISLPHTDLSFFRRPPRLLAMLCVRPDSAGGGHSLLCSGEEVVSKLGAADIEKLERERIRFTPPSHISTVPLLSPVLKRVDSEIHVRFKRESLPDKLPTHLQAFSQAAIASTQRLSLQSGQLLVIDNYRMLHGRTALKGGLASDRVLLRMYAT